MSEILYEIKDAVAVVTLNRPDKLNSVTMDQLNELIVKFNAYEQDDAVRAILLTATGRGFCTGADLSGGGGRPDMAQAGGSDVTKLPEALSAVAQAIVQN